MKFRSILLLAMSLPGLFLPESNVLAQGAAAPAPMQYYLADIEAPFAGVVALLELDRMCQEKFPGECGKPAAVMKDAAGLLDAVSLFVIPRLDYRARQFSSADDVKQVLDSQKPELISELRKFDMKFMGRFGATADVCPLAKQESYVKTLTQLVFHRYWNMQDSELSTALAEIGAIRSAYATKLRANFSPDSCVEIRKQGQLLMEVFKIRLKDSHLDKNGQWQPLTFDEQFLGGAAFLWDLVTKLEADAGNQRFVEYLEKYSEQK
jgi:hypothetical protein